MKGFALSFALLLAGCSGNSFTTAGADATTDGTSGDDGGSLDATGGDGTIHDGAGGDVYRPDGACACEPYWCGCGLCNPDDIACTVNPPGCPLGCASGCPELQLTTCHCEEGRCIRG